MKIDFEALDQAKQRFSLWARSLELAGIIDEKSGVTNEDIRVVGAMLEVSLFVPPMIESARDRDARSQQNAPENGQLTVEREDK